MRVSQLVRDDIQSERFGALGQPLFQNDTTATTTLGRQRQQRHAGVVLGAQLGDPKARVLDEIVQDLLRQRFQDRHHAPSKRVAFPKCV